ncbi:hypothetical protein F5Y04DRAFT_250566 [Hypomontagnella monticulosa]|nr:hypothetical protein F5Y04DRAFT_250566 [Hypomontagnella monticulosa]
MPETLREKAAKKIKGPNANPSQLGDPISIKAEQSDYIPTEGEQGAAQTSQSYSGDSRSENDRGSKNNKKSHHETLREKAAKKLHGPNANPSQLGDPISLKAETTDDVPVEREEGAHSKRSSKL